jgi:ABC-type transporter Mla MlaB component
MTAIGPSDKTESVASLNFSGKLCASSRPLLERLRKLGEQHTRVCIEFGLISDIDSAGCCLLLGILQYWQTQQRQVMLKSQQGLIDKIRSIIEPGRREESDAAWLLLIEILRLMNDTAAYEASCMDYCITFEVSPPAFNPPALSAPSNPHTANRIVLPALIELPIESLLQTIAQTTSAQESVILDCAQLTCIHFTAAAPWIAGLIRLANGKPVELHNTNFLVSVLLKLVGSKSLQISTRKL